MKEDDEVMSDLCIKIESIFISSRKCYINASWMVISNIELLCNVLSGDAFVLCLARHGFGLSVLSRRNNTNVYFICPWESTSYLQSSYCCGCKERSKPFFKHSYVLVAVEPRELFKKWLLTMFYEQS